MKRIPETSIISMDSSISPQLFRKVDDDIIYFDKINMHEGRFCRIRSNKHEVLFEIPEGQVEISYNNEFFHFKLEDNETVITMCSEDGKVLKKINIEGIFFDTFKDNFDNYICLGNKDGSTIIKIINRMGNEAGTIIPSGVLFGSCIYVEEDDIYLGGFDEKNFFKILKFNYIGKKKGEWTLKLESGDRIITKIQKQKNDLILSITGSSDSIAVLHMPTGKYNEIYSGDMEIEYILDFNIYEEKILILDGKSIHEYRLESFQNGLKANHKRTSSKNHSLKGYQYLMYTRGLGECIESGFLFTFLVFTAGLAFIFSSMDELFTNTLTALVIVPCLFWIIHYTIAVIRNMVRFLEKAARIDKLLDLYNPDSKSKLINQPAYTGLMVSSFLTLMFLPKVNLIISIIPGILFFLLFYFLDKRLVNLVKSQNKDVIIELLQPEDQSFKDYIQKSFESIRKNNCERICVDILLLDNLKDNIIEKWARSRRAIIQGIEESAVQNNRVTAVLDMSKRDIKYSRLSIIMDFICFIKREVRIKEIEIAFRDDRK